jgi:hypothetical protein
MLFVADWRSDSLNYLRTLIVRDLRVPLLILLTASDPILLPLIILIFALLG